MTETKAEAKGETRTVRAIGPADGRMIAYVHNRAIYAGDQVEIPAEWPLPRWAELVKRPDKSLTLKPGPGRAFADPAIEAATRRQEALEAAEAAANGEAVAPSQLIGSGDVVPAAKTGQREADKSPL